MSKLYLKQYKNLKISTDSCYAFKLSEQIVKKEENAGIFYFGSYKDNDNPNYKELVGPVGYFIDMPGHKGDNFHILTNYSRDSGEALLLYTDDSFSASFYWGNHGECDSSFGYMKNLNGLSTFTYHGSINHFANGFEIKQEADGGFKIYKCIDDKYKQYGYHITNDGEIFFTKCDVDTFSVKVTEKKSSSLYAVNKKLPKPTAMAYTSPFVKKDIPTVPLYLTKINGENIASGVLIATNLEKKEFERRNINEIYHKEGYVFDFNNQGGTYGYATFKKDGSHNYKGAVLNVTDKMNYVKYISSDGLSDGYSIYHMRGTQNFVIYYEKGNNIQGIGFEINEVNGLFISDNNREDGQEIFYIDFETFSLVDEKNKKTIKHPFFLSDEQENKEELMEELLELTEEETSIEEEPTQEITEQKENTQPVESEPKEKIKDNKSLFSVIMSAFIALIGYVVFPFKWIFNKVKDLLSWIKNKFRRKKRYKRRYNSFSIVDLLEDIWDKIKSFFATIFGFLGSIFKIIGKGILVVLSAILTGILFVPKVIFKGLGAIGDGVKEASFATIVSFAAPLLSGIFLLLVSFNCILPMNDWFSNLVSKDIFSWMGLHLCTLFLNAVGVNFFSVIGVILIFFVDAFYNILLIIFELIMCLIYLIVFFVGVYGIGVVVLVLIILSYVFVARSKGAAVGVTLSTVASIIMLVFYYIALVALWNSVG